MVALGRNPIEASAEAIHSGLLKGQYYTALENAPPTAGVSALFEDRVGKKLLHYDYGKFYVRPVFKPGHCKFCWGPQHLDDSRARCCPYNGACRACLSVMDELPHKGFHHACCSFVLSTPKPVKEDSVTRKRHRDNAEHAPHVPFNHSADYLKRQQKFREINEKAAAAARAASAAAAAAAALALTNPLDADQAGMEE